MPSKDPGGGKDMYVCVTFIAIFTCICVAAQECCRYEFFCEMKNEDTTRREIEKGGDGGDY